MRKIDLTKPEDKADHDALVRLVDDALAVQKLAAAEKNPIRKEALQRNFEMVDAEIERRVYALYALADAEIALVEAAVAPVAEGEKPSSWRPDAAASGGGTKPAGKPKPIGGPRSARPKPALNSKPRKSGSQS